MPKFNCMYAYSVSHYSPTIVVEAATEQEAQEKMEEARRDGKFDEVECESDYDCHDERVLVIGEAEPDAEADDLDNLK
jgi:hypothetical protein